MSPLDKQWFIPRDPQELWIVKSRKCLKEVFYWPFKGYIISRSEAEQVCVREGIVGQKNSISGQKLKSICYLLAEDS